MYAQGRILLVDFEEGRIVPDAELKKRAAERLPFEKWVSASKHSLTKWAELVPRQPLGKIEQVINDICVSVCVCVCKVNCL